jgi:hypothetical protein
MNTFGSGSVTPPPPPPPPHVDDVLGAAPPPPPAAGNRLDRAFPPFSKARLILLLALTPVMAVATAFFRGRLDDLAGLAVVTLGTMAIILAGWYAATKERARHADPTGAPAAPVLAEARDGTSALAIALPFLLSFVLMATLLFSMDASRPGMNLGMAALMSLYMGALWHLRGTILGLVLLSLGAGAIVAFAFGVLNFIFSLWGSDSGYNFWLYWLGASAVSAPFLWPWWRQLRYLSFRGPRGIVAVTVAVVMLVIAIVAALTSDPGSDAPTHGARSIPQAPPPAAPIGAPTQEQAAAGLFAAWRFGNETAAAHVASPSAVETLFAIPFHRRDRLLGCGVFEGTFSECRLESQAAGVLTLGWQRGGDGLFWIDYVAPVRR